MQRLSPLKKWTVGKMSVLISRAKCQSSSPVQSVSAHLSRKVSVLISRAKCQCSSPCPSSTFRKVLVRISCAKCCAHILCKVLCAYPRPSRGGDGVGSVTCCVSNDSHSSSARTVGAGLVPARLILKLDEFGMKKNIIVQEMSTDSKDSKQVLTVLIVRRL